MARRLDAAGAHEAGVVVVDGTCVARTAALRGCSASGGRQHEYPVVVTGGIVRRWAEVARSRVREGRSAHYRVLPCRRVIPLGFDLPLKPREVDGDGVALGQVGKGELAVRGLGGRDVVVVVDVAG